MRARILVPNSMPLTLYLRLNACALLLLVCSSSISCLDNKSEDCPLINTCGEFNYSYPFGEIGSGCGDPDFQVFCDDKSHPLLSISEHKYSILEPHLLGNIAIDENIKVVNDKLCDLSGNSSLSWPEYVFPIASGYTILTFWRDCNQSFNNGYESKLSLCGKDWSYSVDPDKDSAWRPFCKTYLEIPINSGYLSPSSINEKLLSQSFEITWQVDPTKEKTCHVCHESKGSCGYNISAPATFLCHCPDDRTYADKCPGDGPPDSSIHKDTGGRNKPTIIGCSIGGAVLTAIALVLFLRFLVKRRKQPPPPPPRSSISKVEKFLREYAYEMSTRYSQSDLKKMTNNFAEKLGEGGYGVVYKGKLPNGALVAVKILDRHRHSETQFMNEVATIGRVHHVNLVRLLGYCFESPTSALVYEYMANGSLDRFIFAGKEKGQVLMWGQLYSIALGAAHGIAYLHQDCDKRIIHFDIKPHNILLDADFTPKVSDFGLAKLCGKGEDHISMTAGRGTPGYVAPEVCDEDMGPVTDKSDVYSFGIVLLEIVGGRKNIDSKVSRSSQFYFPEWAFKLLETGELGMRLRRGGEMDAEDEDKAKILTKVGLWCIQYNSGDRPCMSRVVQMIEGNGDDVTDPPLPFDPWVAAAKRLPC